MRSCHASPTKDSPALSCLDHALTEKRGSALLHSPLAPLMASKNRSASTAERVLLFNMFSRNLHDDIPRLSLVYGLRVPHKPKNLFRADEFCNLGVFPATPD